MRYALKFLKENIYHKLDSEEKLRNESIAFAEVTMAIDLLVNAKSAGKQLT
jgi:hypothetical protein